MGALSGRAVDGVGARPALILRRLKRLGKAKGDGDVMKAKVAKGKRGNGLGRILRMASGQENRKGAKAG